MEDKQNEILLETDDSFEGSTVFSAPVEHKRKKKANRYKPVIILTSIFLAVAIITLPIVGVKNNWPMFKWLQPLFENEETTVFQPGAMTFDSYANEKITVIHSGATLVMQSSVVEENGTATQAWTLEGYDANLIDSVSLSQIASYAKSIQTFGNYDYDEATEKEAYGFDKPSLTVIVETGDKDADYTLTYGKSTADQSYIYLHVSKDPNKVYLANRGTTSGFLVVPLDLAVNKSIPAVVKDSSNAAYFDEEGNLADFDTITISGNFFENKMVFIPNKDNRFSSYATYICTSPKLRIADGVVEDVRNSFNTGLSASKVVSFDKSAKKLKEFGLDDPDVVVTIKVAGKNYSYTLKATDSSNTQFYFISDNDPMIRTVTISNISYADDKEKDFYLGFMALESISDVSEFSLSGEVDTTFSIQKDEDNDTYIIKNGEDSVVANDFQTFYATFIGTMAIDYETVKTSGKPDLTVKLSHVDGTSPTVLTFYKVSESRYQYCVGGTPMGQISSSAYSKLIREITALIP